MFNLKIITPKKLAFDEEVEAVIVPGTTGEMTILPNHADLLSSLKEGVVTIKKDKEEHYLSIGGGYLETDGKHVIILVSRAFGQDEINQEMTEKAVENAKNILKETEDKKERNEALSVIRRSMIDMKLLSKIKRKAR